MNFQEITRPSEILRQYILPMFPQNEEDFSKSEYPIYIDYQFKFDGIEDKRITILQSNSSAPSRFIQNREYISGNSCDIIVSCKDANEAYTVSQLIKKKLNKSRGMYGVIDIQPLTDVEPLGINAKKLYMFTCSYGIIKED